MTKKEFIDALSDVPDDIDIVFGTDKHLLECVPLNALNISVIRQCTNEDVLDDFPLSMRKKVSFTPKYKTAIVLDAIPYWYLQEKYNITFTDNDKE